MKRTGVLAFAVVFVLLGAVGVGDSQRRTDRGSFSGSVTGRLVGQCDEYGLDFDILANWEYEVKWMDLFDKNGQWVKEVTQYKVLGQSLYYNSEDPDRAVAGGPGEVENGHYDAASGVMSFHGLSWKVRVPGQGMLWFETGTMVFQCDPYTFENCEIVSNTGHDQFVDGDVEALCDYLR